MGQRTVVSGLSTSCRASGVCCGTQKDVSAACLPMSDDMSVRPIVEAVTPALLPEDYVPDVHTRLILYKRLASAGNLEDITELQVELINRFGLLPDQTKALIAQTEFKLRCDALGATKRTRFIEPSVRPARKTTVSPP